MPEVIKVKPVEPKTIRAVNLWNERPLEVKITPDSQYRAIIMADGRIQLYDGVWVAEPMEFDDLKIVEDSTTTIQAALFALVVGITITMPFWLPQLMIKWRDRNEA